MSRTPARQARKVAQSPFARLSPSSPTQVADRNERRDGYSDGEDSIPVTARRTRAERTRTHPTPPKKTADLPHLFTPLGLNHDGGIIVSAQPINGKRLNYDGGVIVKVSHDDA
jgi:hypothetical protein